MIKTNTKLHSLILLLCLIAFLSAVTGGLLYYSALKNYALTRAHEEAEEHLRGMGNHINSEISWYLKAVKAMAGIAEIEDLMRSREAHVIHKVNSILDNFNDVLRADVCYLLDRSGRTMTSSNRNADDSFVGKNYGFRPYFHQAMIGMPAIYMALGITSGKRGIYFSSPIYREGEFSPSGVVVVKAPVEKIEKGLENATDGILVFLDSNGVVFMSGRTDWLYKTLWETSPEKISSIEKTLQYGMERLEWTGIKWSDRNHADDRDGNRYRVHQYEISSYRGWYLIYLHSEEAVSKKIIAPIRKSVGMTALILCVFLGIVILFFYLNARGEIRRRTIAEEKNIKLLREVEELSITDPLTGLNNRRFFEDTGQKIFDLAVRHDRSLAAVMLDLDRFKNVNDTYGHAAGDKVLLTVADTCRKLIRTSDLCARFGGEEFSFLFPEADAGEAYLIAEKLRKAIAGLEIEVDGRKLSVSASFGISERNHDEDSFESIIKRSDDALYEAKHKGRNYTVVWAPRPETLTV